MKRPIPVDRRLDRTRDRIIAEFTALVFAGGFETITVQRLVEAAGIARSTFYEHFASKEDVLRASMARFFGVIADCVLTDEPPDELARVVAHLWDNRRLADAIFAGQARNVLVRNQADLIEARLRSLGEERPSAPLRLAAAALSELQITMLETWLRGRVHCDGQSLEKALSCTSRAAAVSLFDGPKRGA